MCQHRGREKTLLQSLGIMTAPSTWLKTPPHDRCGESRRLSAFVKSCEQGYDGQNQWHLKDSDALDALAQQMPSLPPLVVEGAVHFDRNCH